MGKCSIGLYGLGVMGKSLACNLIRHGFPTAVYSKAEAEREAFLAAPPKEENWTLCVDEASFIQTLERPRVVFLMITSGKPVDLVLEALLPLLDAGDVVIDGGNSHYADTSRRCARAAESGVEFLGVGVSGGEKGALKGPCMMAGGSRRGWEVSRRFLEAIAAHAPDGAPCCAYVGPEGAGHYVKMIHNGIEYAVMQQIADIYALMRDGLGMAADEIAQVFESWRSGPLESYLVDITAAVLRKRDADGTPLVDHVLDVARQKGTGCWSVLEAARRGVYAPCIDEALFTRYHSERREERIRCAQILPCSAAPGGLDLTPRQLERALYAAVLCAYVQGIGLIARASEDLSWDIDLPLTVGLWRSGCIIRSALLTKLMAALREEERALLLTEELQELRELEPDLRQTVLRAIEKGIAVPTLSSALLYYDQSRTARMSVNLVQALRDCFGAHTYERLDVPGTFHSDWESSWAGMDTAPTPQS